jgi:hypothetical protein
LEYKGLIKYQEGIFLADSVNYLDSSVSGMVAVIGSHGGIYAAFKAAASGIRAVILNDAGIGRENAGIACLDYCEKIGMAAAVVSHSSARIGEAADMIKRGIISGANRIAASVGCIPGMLCIDAANNLRNALPATSSPPVYEETRFVISQDTPRIICIDSASLIRNEDVGQIVVTGSHGGLIGGIKAKALNVDALLVVFNDAGFGIDEAGISRLTPLNERGIIAVTVSNSSALIGDSRSTYHDGIISCLNTLAIQSGGVKGEKVAKFIDKVRRKEAGKF